MNIQRLYNLNIVYYKSKGIYSELQRHFFSNRKDAQRIIHSKQKYTYNTHNIIGNIIAKKWLITATYKISEY